MFVEVFDMPHPTADNHRISIDREWVRAEKRHAWHVGLTHNGLLCDQETHRTKSDAIGAALRMCGVGQ